MVKQNLNFLLIPTQLTSNSIWQKIPLNKPFKLHNNFEGRFRGVCNICRCSKGKIPEKIHPLILIGRKLCFSPKFLTFLHGAMLLSIDQILLNLICDAKFHLNGTIHSHQHSAFPLLEMNEKSRLFYDLQGQYTTLVRENPRITFMC